MQTDVKNKWIYYKKTDIINLYGEVFMEKDEVSYYIDNILEAKLIKLNVDKSYTEKIISDIRNKIYSLLKHWNDSKFRETILLLGLEEGKFYKPKNASLKIKCFVVVTIRNSLLETIASVDYKQAGLKCPILDEEIIDITMNAISYFNALNLRKIAEKLDYSNCNDIYYNISNTYKLAWQALRELAFCAEQDKYYDKAKDYNKISLIDLKSSKNSDLKDILSHVDYQSGISSIFSDELLSIIKHVINTSSMKYFFTDCFKHTSRNIEKLFKVIEILLQRDKVFLTTNYYISNNYVAKRTKILRASHTSKDVEYKLKQFNNMSKIHADALKGVEREIK